MSPRVAILIINWNGWEDTIECLESILRLKHDSFFVLVVDNGSTDKSIQELNSWIYRHQSNVSNESSIHSIANVSTADEARTQAIRNREYVLICARQNNGFAAGNNIGMRYAIIQGCEKLWILNNDTVVDPYALSALERKVDEMPVNGVCGSTLLYYRERQVIQALGGAKFSFWLARGKQIGSGRSFAEIDSSALLAKGVTYISGASMLVKSAFIGDIGYMEEKYFLYYEELDWACRSSGRWKNVVAPDSIVFHKVGASIGTDVRSKSSQYYMTRGLLLFYKTHLPMRLPVAWARVLFELLVLAMKGRWPLFRVSIYAICDATLNRTGHASNYHNL